MQPPLQPFRIRLNHRWQSDYCFYVLALTLQYGLHWCYFPKIVTRSSASVPLLWTPSNFYRPISRCRHLSCLCKVFIMSLVVAKRWLLSSMNKEMGSTHPFKASGICHANSPLGRGRTINWPKDLLHTKVWCGAIWIGPTAMYVSEYWFVTDQLNNWGWE